MAVNETVMNADQDAFIYEDRIDQEYEKEVKENFKGTKEEYLELRDYT